jgi:hypothetical protein
MKRLRGKNKGEHLALHQWANDWLSADTDDGKSVIVTPTSVQLEGDEIERLRADEATFASGATHHAGEFWALWDLRDDGTFRRRRSVRP